MPSRTTRHIVLDDTTGSSSRRTRAHFARPAGPRTRSDPSAAPHTARCRNSSRRRRPRRQAGASVRHSGGVITTPVLRRLPVTLAALAALLGATAGSCESPTPPAAPSSPAVTSVPSDEDDVTDDTTDDGPDDTPDDGDTTDDPGEDGPDDSTDDSAEPGNG